MRARGFRDSLDIQGQSLSSFIVDGDAIPGVGVCDDDHDPPVEVVEVGGGGPGAPGGVGVECPHDGEVDGEHVRGKLGEAPPRAREGGEEMLLEGDLVSAHSPPEEKEGLPGVLLPREGENRVQ